MLIVFSEKIIYIDIYEKKNNNKKIEYHQEIFCQLLRFFNPCSAEYLRLFFAPQLNI